jgi:glucosylglycerol-phosphate synthase
MNRLRLHAHRSSSPPATASHAVGDTGTRDQGPLVLAADLDGVFTAGHADQKDRLARRLRGREHTALVYVTGRTTESAQICQEILRLPPADVLVADEGASVTTSRPHPDLVALDGEIEAAWPGTRAVRERLVPVRDLMGEHARGTARRITLFPRHGVSPREAREAVDGALEDVDVTVRALSDGSVEVLPPGVDRLRTTKYVLDRLGVDPRWVVVTGELLSDPSILDHGYWGIVRRDMSASTKAELVHHPRVHFSMHRSATAVLEGLRALGFVA